jgi:hypothetical protein
MLKYVYISEMFLDEFYSPLVYFETSQRDIVDDLGMSTVYSSVYQ